MEKLIKKKVFSIYSPLIFHGNDGIFHGNDGKTRPFFHGFFPEKVGFKNFFQMEKKGVLFFHGKENPMEKPFPEKHPI